MALHIHIHRRPTTDAAWEESKHPRADNGKFGSGGGPGTKAQRLKVLQGQYDKMTTKVPLRDKVKLAAEIKALQAEIEAEAKK
jgi:hypothetical protein